MIIKALEVLETNGRIYVRGSGTYGCGRHRKGFVSLTDIQGFYSIFRVGLKINIRFSDLFMRIGELNQEEAAYLQLEKYDPSLTIESIYYLNSSRPFNYSNIKYPHEEAQFFVQGDNS